MVESALLLHPADVTQKSFGIDIMRAMPDGFTLADANHPGLPLTAINPAFEQMTGYSAREIIGRNCNFLQGADTDPETVAAIGQSLCSGQPFAGEILNYRKDGSSFWNLLRIAPVRDNRGRITCFLGMQTNISEFKKREAEISDLREQLAHLQRVATVSELGACIGHEVNQPLAAIVNNAHAASKFLQLGDLEEVRAALRDMAADGYRASQIVQRLSGLVRPTFSSRQPANLNKIVREAVALLANNLRTQQIKVRFALAADLPWIVVDSIGCLQVLINLITNATQAMQEQSAERCVLVLSTYLADEMVMISVRDSGCGVDDKTMKQMFETFYTTKEDGTGVGLMVARTIVEAHGGWMRVVRNVDCGLTFTVAWPR